MLLNEERPIWLPTLHSGEQLLWQGRASRRPVAFRLSDAPHLLSGVVLLYVGLDPNAFFGLLGGFGNDPSPPPLFTLVTTMFVAFGLFELIGRHLINFVRRFQTSYALTTHRVFIRTGVFRPVTRQRALSPNDPPEFEISGNGSGTIIFAAPEPGRRSAGRRRGRDLVEAVSSGLDGFQFYRVPDAERLQALLAHD